MSHKFQHLMYVRMSTIEYMLQVYACGRGGGWTGLDCWCCAIAQSTVVNKALNNSNMMHLVLLP